MLLLLFPDSFYIYSIAFIARDYDPLNTFAELIVKTLKCHFKLHIKVKQNAFSFPNTVTFSTRDFVCIFSLMRIWKTFYWNCLPAPGENSRIYTVWHQLNMKFLFGFLLVGFHSLQFEMTTTFFFVICSATKRNVTTCRWVSLQ